MFSHSFLILFWCNLVTIEGQSSSVGWQSFFGLSGLGMKFSPNDEQALLLSDNEIDSFEACTLTCHANDFCRIFDFDGQTNHCRLFEGDATIMGSIIASSSSLSIAGSVQLTPEQFISQGLPCSFCTIDRYLICINSSCRCPPRTYFDGSICRSQNIVGGQCTNDTDCRNDLNLTCLPRKQCGSLSLQNGVTVGGYSNGTTGNTGIALYLPYGIVVANDGSLFVSEMGNARVTHLPVGSLTGTVVAGTGIPGNGPAQLNYPTNLYLDTASNIYISDALNSRAMLWLNNSSTGVLVASTSPVGSARFIGIAVDSQKNIYTADTDHHRVTKWAPNATNGTVIAGTGVIGSGSQQLYYPYGLHLDELHSYLYVADTYNNRIQRFKLGVSMNGTTVAGGNGQGSNNNQLYYPQGVYVSKTGTIYIADTYNNRITRWNLGATSGVTIAGIAGSYGTAATLLYGPSDVALSQNETYLYVTDLNNNRVQRFELI